MNIKEAIVGKRVNHSRYGNGVIIDINNESGVIRVKFDLEFEGKKERNMSPSTLTEANDTIEIKEPEDSKQESNDLKIGDNVYHEQYGNGIVLQRKGFFKSLVKFKDNGQEIIVLNNSLSLISVNLFDDDEMEDENIDSSFKIIPSNYSEQSCYSSVVKRFLTHLRKNYDEGFATIKSYSVDDGSIGVFVVPNKGIIVYNLIDRELDVSALTNPLFEELYKNKYYNFRKYYCNAFLQSKNFCNFINNADKTLKYPTKFVFLFQNVDISKISVLDRKKIVLKNRNFYFKNFTTNFDNNDIFSNFEQYDQGAFSYIDSSLFGSIIERVVPENATLVSIVPNKNDVPISQYHNPTFYPITGKEIEFSALALDDSEIKTINDTKPGHYLTLANPGTGKSVLLVSKAYRIQSIKNDNHVLITCYNNNLAERHNIFAKTSGMKTRNLHICTFHKFVIDTLEKVKPNFVKKHPLDEDDKNFDVYVNRFESYLDANPNALKLNAIFIDEIQLFESKWIDICYKMLDKEGGKNYYFEMYGDINQDVKSLRSKGKASWQNTKCLPSLQGRVKNLEKNYRNTDLIANYLTCLITDFNDALSKHGISIDPESACLSSETMRKGKTKTRILISGVNDVSKILKTINDLIEKYNADYNDIAIIYPAKGYGQYYKPLYYLQNELDSKGIPYSKIHGELKTKIYECDGVVLSTIDSCLGLDFKYVILCGIHYWDFIHNEENEKTEILDKKKLLFDKNAKLYWCEIGKKIYSACSRARDGLIIIDDTKSDSLIKSIIRPVSGRSYFNEY